MLKSLREGSKFFYEVGYGFIYLILISYAEQEPKLSISYHLVVAERFSLCHIMIYSSFHCLHNPHPIFQCFSCLLEVDEQHFQLLESLSQNSSRRSLSCAALFEVVNTRC